MNRNMNKEQGTEPERDGTNNRLEGRSSIPNDLPDSEKDRDELKSEETFIDLPDVKDIPGQEFVNVPNGGISADTTLSSDDEEGLDVFDLDDSENFTMGNEGDVSRGERRALDDTDYLPTNDENNLRDAAMDRTDFQGENLEERSFGEGRSGRENDERENGD